MRVWSVLSGYPLGEAVGMRLTLRSALIRFGTDELLPLQQHRGVEQQAKSVGQGCQAALGDGVEQVVW